MNLIDRDKLIDILNKRIDNLNSLIGIAEQSYGIAQKKLTEYLIDEVEKIRDYANEMPIETPQENEIGQKEIEAILISKIKEVDYLLSRYGEGDLPSLEDTERLKLKARRWAFKEIQIEIEEMGKMEEISDKRCETCVHYEGKKSNSTDFYSCALHWFKRKDVAYLQRILIVQCAKPMALTALIGKASLKRK